MGRDQNQGDRGGNLSDEDRSQGGQTSANEQDCDSQGQFSGMGGSSSGSSSSAGSSSGGSSGGS